MKLKFRIPRPLGYSLVEALVATGILAAAIGAASALSMTLARQEEISSERSAATHFAEAVARLWQLGINQTSEMSAFLLRPMQTDSSGGVTSMTYTITPQTNVIFTADPPAGGNPAITQGAMERATITVSYFPYVGPGVTPSAVSVSLEVLRPQAGHR